MLKDRRKFIVATGMAASGALISGLSAANKVTSTPEAQVARMVSKYGVTVGEAKIKGDTMCLKVKVQSREGFSRVFTNQDRYSLESVCIRPGNQMDLVCRGQKFAISHSA
ncbi:hypothetical protein V2O64_11865 [Verrucomicrobiaceae bacterium 227]